MVLRPRATIRLRRAGDGRHNAMSLLDPIRLQDRDDAPSNRTRARTVKGLLFLLNVEPEGKFPEARIGSSLLEVKPIITKVFPRPVGPESRSRAKGQAQFHQ